MSSQQLQQLRPLMDASREKMVGELDQVRQGFEEMLTQFGPAPGVTFRPAQIGSIRGTWATPHDVADGRVLLYLHGGGFALGSSKAYSPLASELASRLNGRVLVPDYRLAPENPYPAALEDAVSAYRWLLAEGTPAASIGIAGDSCGGGLTVAALVAIRDAGLPLPVGAVLISAWADLSATSDSITSKAAEDFVLNGDMLRGMAGGYLGATPPRTPGASPVYANLKGLPPLLIQVGATEVLFDDSMRLAANAGAAGVKVRLDIWPEMFHVWHTWSAKLDEAGEALDDAAAFLDQLFRLP
jgi:monoterpene epsilon-lactone hydrolase